MLCTAAQHCKVFANVKRACHTHNKYVHLADSNISPAHERGDTSIEKYNHFACLVLNTLPTSWMFSWAYRSSIGKWSTTSLSHITSLSPQPHTCHDGTHSYGPLNFASDKSVMTCYNPIYGMITVIPRFITMHAPWFLTVKGPDLHLIIWPACHPPETNSKRWYGWWTAWPSGRRRFSWWANTVHGRTRDQDILDHYSKENDENWLHGRVEIIGLHIFKLQSFGSASLFKHVDQGKSWSPSFTFS